MTIAEPVEELPPAVAHVTLTYLGPVAPHWEMRRHFGDERLIDDFRARVDARLLLLPKHDPQFRRNRERVNRDAEREFIRVDWDLGDEMVPSSAVAVPVEGQVEAPDPGSAPAAAPTGPDSSTADGA